MSIWLFFLEQAGLTGCLLLSIGLSVGLTRPSPLRLMLLSWLTAGLSAWMMTAPTLLRVSALLSCAVLAPLLSWPDSPRRLHMRMIATGCFLSLCVTGVMRFAQPLGIPAGLLVLGSCLLLRAVPMVRPHLGELPRLATVDIRHGAHHLTLTALIDSGNLLRDGISGLPVIVISRRAAQRLVQLPPEGRLIYPFRLLCVRTVSGTSMMMIFHPDSVYLQTASGWQRVETLLGVSPEGYDGFQALVPACLMLDEAAMPV